VAKAAYTRQELTERSSIRPAPLQAWGDTNPGCFDLENELTPTYS